MPPAAARRLPAHQQGQASGGKSSKKGKQKAQEFLEDHVPITTPPKESAERLEASQPSADDLPVQQIVQDDFDSPPLEEASKSATEVLMSVEPYNHAQSEHHHQDSDERARRGSRLDPISGLPLPAPHRVMNPIRHPFNTHRFVSQLESHGFERKVAEAFMRATKAYLVDKENSAAQHLVGKGDLENQAYLFAAALGELQTEVQVQARNDGIALRSANGQLQREIDFFTQKLREEIQELKNESVIGTLVDILVVLTHLVEFKSTSTPVKRKAQLSKSCWS